VRDFGVARRQAATCPHRVLAEPVGGRRKNNLFCHSEGSLFALPITLTKNKSRLANRGYRKGRIPLKLANFGKQLRLIAQDAKRLDAHIQVVKKMFLKGNFRML
jgi:hypothetical protein